jgi:hypothetical protein
MRSVLIVQAAHRFKRIECVVEAVKPPTRQADEERQFAALFKVGN